MRLGSNPADHARVTTPTPWTGLECHSEFEHLYNSTRLFDFLVYDRLKAKV
jgi:hypothetical protein